MRQPALVLVVAPDSAFRHSLEFALEAEGFRVSAYETIAKAASSKMFPCAACAVVDDKAVVDLRDDVEALQNTGKPLLLLTSESRKLPPLPMARILTKPYLGELLVDAVLASVAPIGELTT
ncbi:MAG: hypothetical protein R3D70_15020 [Rhizobiaceae bacterium]